MPQLNEEFFYMHFDNYDNISLSTTKKPKLLNSFSNNLYKHNHRHYEILYIMHGDVSIQIADQIFMPKANTVFIIPPNTYHYVHILSDKPYKRAVIIVSNNEENKTLIESVFGNDTAVQVSNTILLQEYFMRIKNYYLNLPTSMLYQISKNLLKEFFCVCNLSISNSELDSEATLIFNNIIEYINSNFTTISNISQIAKELYVSTPYIYKLFKKKLNVSPKTYIDRLKIKYAYELIQQGVNKTAVSELVGYSEYSSFYRAYKRMFNNSPSTSPVKKPD